MRATLGSDTCLTPRGSTLSGGASLFLALAFSVGLLAQTNTIRTVSGTVVEVLWSNNGSQVRVLVHGKVYQLDLAAALSGHGATEQEAKDWAKELQNLKPGEAVAITIRGPLNENPGGVTATVSIRPAPQGSGSPAAGRSAASPLDPRCTTIM